MSSKHCCPQKMLSLIRQIKRFPGDCNIDIFSLRAFWYLSKFWDISFMRRPRYRNDHFSLCKTNLCFWPSLIAVLLDVQILFTASYSTTVMWTYVIDQKHVLCTLKSLLQSVRINVFASHAQAPKTRQTLTRLLVVKYFWSSIQLS